MTSEAPPVLLWLSSLVLIAFIVVPLLAIFVRVVPIATVDDFLSDPVVRQALTLSLITAAITVVISVATGLPLAFLLARYRFRGHSLLDTLVDLPMVLPPAVAGVALLMAFGRKGLLGTPLSELFGIELPFTTAAVVIAQVFVSAPFFVKSARAGFEGVDRNLEQVSATLGVSRIQTFRSITIPLALPALLGGVVMTWARALGEFGATIMFAGSFPGRTQTMPLAIFQTMESGSLNAALVLSAILIIVSFIVLLVFKGLAKLATTETTHVRA